jgi:hypothetical protein
MNRPLMIGPDGLVVSATKREVAHLSHCLERGVKAPPSNASSQSVTNQTPCSCGGSNDNCARCYGRGFIDTTRGSPDALPYTYVPPLMPQTRKKKKKKPGRTQNLSRSHDSLPPSSTRSPAVVTVGCPSCEFKGNPYDFARHFSLLHGSKKQVPMKMRIYASSKIVRQRERPRQQVKNSQLPRSTEDASQKSVRQIGNVQVEKPWGDKLDATKNCGYPAREEGRYGSYPSHDGFDDESKP